MLEKALLVVSVVSLAAPAHAARPPELGAIEWRRGFDAGLAEARKVNRPALVLFDEVPGCSTVNAYGKEVLSHPLIVEAAETLFVPIFVSNNEEGEDRAVLKSFGEPAWNNPVVRIVDADRKPLAPRVAGDYTAPGLARAMAAALGERAPKWLGLLALEGGSTERATFSMYCFWSGEAALGALDGVVRTRAAFLDGHEVVDVDYDPKALPLDALVSAANAASAKQVSGQSRPSEKDTKYHLAASPWRAVWMTEAQKSRVNSALAHGGDPKEWLSPRQIGKVAR